MVRGHFFGLTGLGDRTTVSAFSTLDFEEQQTLQIAHDFGIGGSGLRLGGQFTYSWADPDLGADLPIKSRTSFATIEASYPLIRRQSSTVRASLGLDIVGQKVKFGPDPLTEDKLRVAFLRLAGDAADTGSGDRRYTTMEPRWRLAGVAEVRQGLDILGASDGCDGDFVGCVAAGVPPSDLEGDPTATVLRGAAAAEFRPMPRFTLAANARGQYAWDPLFSFESFSVGNFTVGRGYDPGIITGDKGAGLQGEIRVGSAYPRSRNSFVAEPFVFVDQAWIRNENRVFIGPGHSDELTSVGGGVRAGYGDAFRLDVLVAVPLDRPEILTEKPDPRVLISLTTRLWPWSL
jgi:hemolysin activation/secretion protein